MWIGFLKCLNVYDLMKLRITFNLTLIIITSLSITFIINSLFLDFSSVTFDWSYFLDSAESFYKSGLTLHPLLMIHHPSHIHFRKIRQETLMNLKITLVFLLHLIIIWISNNLQDWIHYLHSQDPLHPLLLNH